MKKTLVLLFLILLLGSFLRLYKLTAKELWYDEAFSAEIIKNSYPEVFRLATFDVHPPLYYFILKLTADTFGNSEFVLRLPSVIFGVALIILIYYIAIYMKFTNSRALLAALVVATNPFLINYAREARSYSMLAFLTVLAFFFLLRALRKKTYFSIIFTLLLLFLTHYISVFFIFVCTIVLLRHNRKVFWYLLPLALVIVLWTPTIIGSSHSVGLNWVPRFTWVRLPQSAHAFILGTDTNKQGVHPPLNPFAINTTIVSVLIFIGVFILIIVTKPSTETKLLLVCGIIPIGLVAATSLFLDVNLYVERYMTGYAALIILYLFLLVPKPIVTIPYIALCIFLVLTFKPTSIGYRELAKYKSLKPMVMVDATDYITAKHYVPDIKLQEGDWDSWVILHEDDIFKKLDYGGVYYLVNRGPIENWKPEAIANNFYFFKYEY